MSLIRACDLSQLVDISGPAVQKSTNKVNLLMSAEVKVSAVGLVASLDHQTHC